MSERARTVRVDLADLADQARATADEAGRRCAEATRAADQTTGQLGATWTQRIAAMRKRPMAARADWRNDQMTDGQR